MSMEDAAVVARDGTVRYWHSPENRAYAALPDSPELWDVIWGSREEIEGIAHTHPGEGYPVPSRTDLTTFEAVEKGIGRRIKWWILSANLSVLLEWNPENPGYDVTSFLFPEHEPPWMRDLRRRSYPDAVIDAVPA